MRPSARQVLGQKGLIFFGLRSILGAPREWCSRSETRGVETGSDAIVILVLARLPQTRIELQDWGNGESVEGQYNPFWRYL